MLHEGIKRCYISLDVLVNLLQSKINENRVLKLTFQCSNNGTMKQPFYHDLDWLPAYKTEPRHAKKALMFFFTKMCICLFLWMYVIFRLVYETFSRISVKISYLWVLVHGLYEKVSLSANMTSWSSRNDTHNFTSVNLYMNIIFFWKTYKNRL